MTVEDAPAAREYLTTKELAALLRIRERKVYELAAAGEVPCSKVTGKLLFPERAVRAWLEAARSGPRAAGAAVRPAVFLGSHDPLLDWALRESRSGLATFFDGSIDGLERFAAREGVATGLHLYDAGADDWNVPAVSLRCAGEPAVLVAWATRRRGLIVAKDDGAVRGLGDLAGRRVAMRQRESGAHALFAHSCGEAGVPLEDFAPAPVARSEADAALAVAHGSADAAFGLEALAAQFGLGFVAVAEERFDLLVDRRAWFEPPMQRLLGFCRSDAFAGHAARFAGYDVSDLGAVRWNGA